MVYYLESKLEYAKYAEFPWTDIDIEEVIRHPSYLLTTTPHNDIALALLQESVIYSEHIRPLCLPNAQDVFYGQRCIATGWGVDVRTRKSPPVMKRMELEIISRMECQALYQFGGAGGNFRLHRSVVCANAVQDQASCMYDGGSPLACQKADGSYVLAGITSWGVECGQLDLPGVYVDVTKFTSWINDKIDQYDEEELSPEFPIVSSGVQLPPTMYLRSIIVLMVAVLVNAESNIIENPTFERQVDYKCGISNPEGLVYNVESELKYAKYAEFPWTVAIFEESSSENNPELTHIGGGTLIHPKFVVAAAHTMEKPHRYVARFGEWNMKSDAEAFPSQDIEIEEVIKHPLYRESATPGYDIALAVLKENVIYSEHIRPICLPSVQDVFYGQQCIVSGWGVDIRTGQPPIVMKRMEVNVETRKRCLGLYRDLGVPINMQRGEMCVDAVEDQNACIKDAGSPLACQKADGSYVLAGISSWVLNCHHPPTTPAGILNITKFACWINDTIREHGESGENLNPIIIDFERYPLMKKFVTYRIEP
uniref:Peptidase S1 domain-containing protein n=1 Tax=Anopheles culicifacies TaxID=139723 RepID=A0A182MED8_9DIPT